MVILAQELEVELAILTKKFEDAVADKLRCETEAEKTAETIDLANRLVNGLASENQRWKDTVSKSVFAMLWKHNLIFPPPTI